MEGSRPRDPRQILPMFPPKGVSTTEQSVAKIRAQIAVRVLRQSAGDREGAIPPEGTLSGTEKGRPSSGVLGTANS